jgi:hypothetical protein
MPRSRWTWRHAGILALPAVIAAAAGAPVAAADTPLTAEGLANTTTAANQEDIRIGAGGGQFVVVWHGDGQGIVMRRYGADGAPLAGETVIAPDADDQEPEIAVRADGSFVVVYERFVGGAQSTNSYLRRFSAAGAPLDAGELTVPAETGNAERDPDVAVHPDDGAIVVAWYDESDGRIEGRRFEADGDAITAGDLVLHAHDTPPAVTAQPGGTFVVAWEQAEDVFLKRFDGAGTLQGVQTGMAPVNAGTQRQPALAARADGSLETTWRSGPTPSAASDVLRRGLTATLGSVLGTPPATTETDGIEWSPQVAVTDAGSFVVAWEDFVSGSADVEFRRFARDGTALGADVPGAAGLSPTGRYDRDPDPALLPDGTLGLVWTRAVPGPGGPPDESFDVIVRFFAPGTGGTPGPAPGDPPTTTGTPAPPTAGTPAPRPAAFRDVVLLPSPTGKGARACVSRRRFRIRLREPSGVRIRSATVKLAGRTVATRRGRTGPRRVTAPIDLRGLPKGRWTVSITVVTEDGRTLRGARSYRTCVPRRR